MKKLISLVLALALVLAVAVASAASITITHDASYEGATGTTARVYEAYKVFDASYDTLAGENSQAAKDTFDYGTDVPVSYSMATDSPWLSAMQAPGQTWFDVALAADGSKYIVTPKTSAYTTSAHAQAFGAYLEANIPSTAAKTEVTVDGSAATVDKGYYLIIAKDSKDGVTRLAVVTTDATLVEKNTYITTGKTTSQTSYNVGDTVTYTATVFIPSDTALTETDGTGYKAGHGPVILHDKMDSQLTMSSAQFEAISATVDNDEFTGFTTANSGLGDECTFEITIPVTSTLLGKTITFTYSATLNDTAADDTGYVNELFGELNGYKTNPDDQRVYTFDFSFLKDFVGVDDESLTATFELRTTANDASTAIKFNALASGKQEKSDDETGDATITIHDGETINLVGLKAGIYYLVEKTTSAGYNLLDGPVTVTITEASDSTPEHPKHTVTCEGGNISDEGVITVNNNSGTVLPSTGGIGTTIFYIVGGILLVGAAIVLVARRKAQD